ncbi:MAG: 3-deoxy-7-phosphoheptulonate synthase [Candidatus Brocadiaceae bacterium]|nr:3-deoxy-7-phosphoheptulonate synthase [Candidatus Brocadiaceae bacterium]
MIIVMQPTASEDEVQHVVERVEEAGLEVVRLRGEKRNVIAAIGDRRDLVTDRWLALPGVERVVPILSPYKLASREAAPGATPVRINGSVLGGRAVQVIAGPCAVEDYDCTLRIARCVKAAGAVGLRGGAYKPRTSPHSFQGLEEDGLKILHAVGQEVGLPIITEVLSPDQVDTVCRYADVLQVGARNMQNYSLLKGLGRIDKPVLLKRGISATVDELLLAAEYILKGGNPRVILCCRGIRTFEDHMRYTLSLGTVAHLKEVTHLPVIVDPSHPAGRRSLVAPMAKAAVACGADGLLIEVHPAPETAPVDGRHTLTCEGFETLMGELRLVAEAVGRTM